MEWFLGKTPPYQVTFDDVLIRPAYSTLTSRADADPYFKITANKIEYVVAPVICANMSTIATLDMYKAVGPLGIMVPFHRFQTVESQMEEINGAVEFMMSNDYGAADVFAPVSATVGLHDRERSEKILKTAGLDVVFLEVAHADSKLCEDEIKWIKDTCPDKMLVAGNIATREASQRLKDAGADVVKCGIASGMVCHTKYVTGCGVPQLAAVMDIYSYDPLFMMISDGGHIQSGDCVKSLAAGARFVMLGSMFAGTEQTNQRQPDNMYVYSGMASREAGKVVNGNVPEGISTTVFPKGSAVTVAKSIIAGIRQGMAMVGVDNLQDLRDNAVFQFVSPKYNC